jgi:DNA-binding MarR family transcriptional regulator
MRVPWTDETGKRLFLHMAEFGEQISAAIEDEAGPEFRSNAVVMMLFYLDLEGPTRPGELQERLGYTSGGTSRLLERLEQADVVERTYGAVRSDRRAVLVQLTPKGQEISQAMARALERRSAELTVLVKALYDLTTTDDR